MKHLSRIKTKSGSILSLRGFGNSGKACININPAWISFILVLKRLKWTYFVRAEGIALETERQNTQTACSGRCQRVSIEVNP